MHPRTHLRKRSQQFGQLLRSGKKKIRWTRKISRSLERPAPCFMALIGEDQVKSFPFECARCATNDSEVIFGERKAIDDGRDTHVPVFRVFAAFADNRPPNRCAVALRENSSEMSSHRRIQNSQRLT